MRALRLLSSFFRSTFLWVLLVPYVITGLGAASNQLVLIANHDTFPVLMRDNLSDRLLPDKEGHVLMGPNTHLNFLGDVFDFHDGWISVGDLMLTTGGWLENFCPFIYIALVTIKLSGSSDQTK